MANTTFNPGDKASSVTLSNGNLTATQSSNGTVRAIDGYTISGKYYFEISITTLTGGGVGIANALAPLVTTTWNNAVTVGFGGPIWNNNVNTGINIGSVASGSLVCVAVDFVNKMVWFRLGAAGNWNGNVSYDPAMNVGGVGFIGILSGPLYPYAFLFSPAGAAVTANFGNIAFSGVVPSGFTAGWPQNTGPARVVGTQAALEQFLTVNPPAQITQAAVEQWASTATITGQALVTQIALEQWALAAAGLTVDLAGNLGGASPYGKLSYGLKLYSRISAFAPAFSGALDNSLRNVSGGFTPVISFDADLQVARLDLFNGDLAPQIALGGSLSLDLLLTVLEGGLIPNVVLGASSFVSGPLWADTDPCPSPLWAPSDPCPPPPWMTSAPCDPVVWSKSRTCNG